MELYKTPIMKIVELEKVDVLTESGPCPYGCGFSGGYLDEHIQAHHHDQYMVDKYGSSEGPQP